MEKYKLAEMERKFAKLIWAHAPIASGELAKLCATELDWKRPTTYTVLRKLCERGIFSNENGTVTALMSEECFLAKQGEEYLSESFGGSLPKFLVAFANHNDLKKGELDALQSLIDNYKED
ncbi:MAG: BlaI/MecI/CopY family transcriptional regulator [Faecalibacterium sp.]